MLLLALPACSGADDAERPVAVDVPPAGGPEVEAACRALLEQLPDEVDPGATRRPVEPQSDRTAAWGDPPVVLECGVEAPERDEPPFAVDGVVFTTRDVGAATRWTTYGRTVRAAVTVPDDYSGAEVVLSFAQAVDAALPVDPAAPPVLDLEPEAAS